MTCRHRFAAFSLVACLACAALFAGARTALAGESSSVLGRKVPDFVLTDAQGEARSLADYRGKRLLCLVTLGTACPVGNLYLPVLNDLQARYADQVQIVGVNANPGDTPAEIAAHAAEYKIAFPVLKDADGRLTGYLGAERTNEVFLVDPRQQVRYHGRIDDRYGVDYKRDEPSRHDLEEAIKELAERKDVSVKETEVAGCRIARPKAAGHVEVTYTQEVSRIIQQKCQNCHRSGTAAPFALANYDDATNWAEMIKEVVVDRRMPPWHADPRFGEFSNDRRLTQEEIDQLTAWVDAGAPRGDAQLPAEKQYTSGWMIGEPDVVFEMPEEVTIPATGVVPYKYFETPTNFKEDVWVQAAEARPGNRGVVHHIIVFYKMPDEQKNEGGESGEGFARGWVVGTAPGDMPLVLPPGVALKVPAGATLVWQMHYTPTGKEEKDRSQMALKFYKEPTPPRSWVHKLPVANTKFEIPPGATHFAVESEHTFDRDVRLLSFMPHMHVRGKDFLYEAIFPDGRRETLLSVPRYDFNWQSSYRFAKPVPLPAGTKVHCTAHFDNSPDNPANPDPKSPVRWGEQTFEEMMIGYGDFIYAEPDGPGAPPRGEKGEKAQETAQAAGEGERR
ncbi:MAG: redoxin domain-containing protein [Pirellulales bacterium]